MYSYRYIVRNVYTIPGILISVLYMIFISLILQYIILCFDVQHVFGPLFQLIYYMLLNLTKCHCINHVIALKPIHNRQYYISIIIYDIPNNNSIKYTIICVVITHRMGDTNIVFHSFHQSYDVTNFSFNKVLLKKISFGTLK